MTTLQAYPIEAVHLIQAEEGCRLVAYPDSRGIWTIGYGYNLEAHGYSKEEAQGIVWTKDQALLELRNEIDLVVPQLDKRWPTWRSMSVVRQSIVMSSVYQLGAPRAAKFLGTIDALYDHDYARVARQMLASRWATQTPARVKRNAEAMETDSWPSQVNGGAFDPDAGISAEAYFALGEVPDLGQDRTHVDSSQESIVTEKIRDDIAENDSTSSPVSARPAPAVSAPAPVANPSTSPDPSPCRVASILGIPLSKKMVVVCMGIVVLVLNQNGIMQLAPTDIDAIKQMVMAYIVTQGGVDIISSGIGKTIKNLLTK